MKESAPSYHPDEIVRSGFGLAKAEKGSSYMFDLSVSTFALLLKGTVSITIYGSVPLYIESGSMGIFPVSRYHTIKMEEDVVSVFLYIIGDNLSFCRSVLTDESIRNLTDMEVHDFSLPIQPTIHKFAEQIEHYIENRHRFKADISEAKQMELQALLTASYSQEELCRLLAPLFHSHGSFFYKVTDLANQFLTTDQMADKLNMSRSAFLRHFSETFQQTPKRWSDRIRSLMLERALRESSEPLSHIANRLKFCSQQQMNAFCRSNLGAPPMMVRAGVRRLNCVLTEEKASSVSYIK